jgi:hypothetical protein
VISLDGGVAVNPTNIIRSIANASDERNTDPTLMADLILSRITTTDTFAEAL